MILTNSYLHYIACMLTLKIETKEIEFIMGDRTMNIYDLMIQFLKDEFAKEDDFYRINLMYQAISALNDLKKSGTADSNKNKDWRLKHEQMDTVSKGT